MLKFLKLFNIFLAILLIFSIGYLFGNKYYLRLSSESPYFILLPKKNEEKVNALLSLIDNEYINQVQTDTLLDNAMSGIIHQLDPHSVYISRNKVSQYDQDVEGHFVGIGIEYLLKDDTIMISRVLNSSNAELLKVGDKLIKGNNSSLIKKNYETVSKILRGKEHSSLALTLVRDNGLKRVVVKRQSISLPSISAAYMMDKNIGYIKLNTFSSNSYSELTKNITQLKSLGMKSLILDLRENGGGLMEEAVKIADEFLPNNQIIVRTKDKNKKSEVFKTEKQGVFEQGKIVVLINEYSASASEILTAALQDNKRATVMGRRSYGKGLIQKEVSLNDGSKVRLTVAEYFTPNGNKIQKPYTNIPESQYSEEIHNRYYSGELSHKNSKKQIGGITPDIYLPIENSFYALSISPDIISDIQFYVIELSKNKSLRNMSMKNYLVYPMQKEVQNFTKKYPHLSKEENNFIHFYIKASLAKILYGETAYYRIFNQKDNEVSKAMEQIINSPN